MIQQRQQAAEPGIDGGLGLGARRCTDGRHQSRLKLDAKTVGQSNARRRRVHDSGLGGKVSSRVRGNSAGDTIVVSLYRLIHPFGEGQVGESVVGVEQRVGRAVQRGQLRRVRRRKAGNSPRVRSTRRIIVDLVDELLAVYHVARLDGFNGNVGRSLGGSHGIRNQGKRFAQWEDELVHLDRRVVVVQNQLELVAEQRAEAVAISYSLDQ